MDELDTLIETASEMATPNTGVEIKTRRSFFKNFENCFVGLCR